MTNNVRKSRVLLVLQRLVASARAIMTVNSDRARNSWRCQHLPLRTMVCTVTPFTIYCERVLLSFLIEKQTCLKGPAITDGFCKAGTISFTLFSCSFGKRAQTLVFCRWDLQAWKNYLFEMSIETPTIIPRFYYRMKALTHRNAVSFTYELNTSLVLQAEFSNFLSAIASFHTAVAVAFAK